MVAGKRRIEHRRGRASLAHKRNRCPSLGIRRPTANTAHAGGVIGILKATIGRLLTVPTPFGAALANRFSESSGQGEIANGTNDAVGNPGGAADADRGWRP